jgi:hypothetical protein
LKAENVPSKSVGILSIIDIEFDSNSAKSTPMQVLVDQLKQIMTRKTKRREITKNVLCKNLPVKVVEYYLIYLAY